MWTNEVYFVLLSNRSYFVRVDCDTWLSFCLKVNLLGNTKTGSPTEEGCCSFTTTGQASSEAEHVLIIGVYSLSLYLSVRMYIFLWLTIQLNTYKTHTILIQIRPEQMARSCFFLGWPRWKHQWKFIWQLALDRHSPQWLAHEPTSPSCSQRKSRWRIF